MKTYKIKWSKKKDCWKIARLGLFNWKFFRHEFDLTQLDHAKLKSKIISGGYIEIGCEGIEIENGKLIIDNNE